MVRDRRVPLVIQEAISRVEVRGNRAGQEIRNRGYARSAPISYQGGLGERVGHHVSKLEAGAVGKSPLQFQNDAVRIGVASLHILRDTAVRRGIVGVLDRKSVVQ